MRLSKADAEHFRNVADRYVLATGVKEFEVGDVVDWGMALGDLTMHRKRIRDVFMSDMSEALRSHVAKDEAGNQIRLRHCVQTLLKGNGSREQQQTLWAHLDDARDEFMIQSFRQRRRRCVADV